MGPTTGGSDSEHLRDSFFFSSLTGAAPHVSGTTSRCMGFNSCGTQALQCDSSVAVAYGQLSCVRATSQIRDWTRVSPALAAGLPTSGRPRKSISQLLNPDGKSPRLKEMSLPNIMQPGSHYLVTQKVTNKI